MNKFLDMFKHKKHTENKEPNKEVAVEAVKEKLPINRIKISGTEILNINLNQGWEITDVKFDNTCPSAYIDELVVTFSKSRGRKNEVSKSGTD